MASCLLGEVVVLLKEEWANDTCDGIYRNSFEDLRATGHYRGAWVFLEGQDDLEEENKKKGELRFLGEGKRNRFLCEWNRWVEVKGEDTEDSLEREA